MNHDKIISHGILYESDENIFQSPRLIHLRIYFTSKNIESNHCIVHRLILNQDEKILQR